MLEERLFPPAKLKPGVRRYVEPDWAALVREMKRPGVNLMILWEEYHADSVECDQPFRRIVIIGSGDHDHAGDGGSRLSPLTAFNRR